jgi:DNA-binding NarL/FixJ family response regulator
MSETLTALIFDAATGQATERPLTAKEISEHQEMQAETQARQAEQAAKIASRQSALAKLAALGLTEDEIGAL